MNDQQIIEEFLEYNKTHLKSITASMKMLGDKYGCSWLTIRKIIGKENIELVKNNPSQRQYDVMIMTIKGMSQANIARELSISRQVINDCLKFAVNKDLMQKVVDKDGKLGYNLTEDGIEFIENMKEII